MEEIVSTLAKLQNLRGEIPTYILFDDISPIAWFQMQKETSKVPHSKEVDVVIFSAGGLPDYAYRMIRTFRKKYDVVNIVVPFWAKSAATLFAFGGTRIVFHECGELGPIDVQIRKDDERSAEGEWSSALNVASSITQIEKRSREGVVEMFTKLRNKAYPEIIKIGRRQLAEMLLEYSASFYSPLLQKVDPMEMGQMARALEIGKMYARRILKQYSEASDENILELLDFLVYECPDHGYVVDYDMIKPYLPSVMKADTKPFSREYYEKLDDIVLLLLNHDGNIRLNGFISSFISETKPVNINKQDDQPKKESTATQSQATADRGSSSRPTKNKVEKVITSGGKTINSAR